VILYIWYGISVDNKFGYYLLCGVKSGYFARDKQTIIVRKVLIWDGGRLRGYNSLADLCREEGLSVTTVNRHREGDESVVGLRVVYWVDFGKDSNKVRRHGFV